MGQCARCGDRRDCRTYTPDAVDLCEQCHDLVILEWNIQRQEIGELIES